MIKKHRVIPCEHHEKYTSSCHYCLIDSVIHLCELLDENPEVAMMDEDAMSTGLMEVFAGLNVAHITDHSITNVTALPMTPADLEEGIIRYTVEFKRN